MEKLTKQEEEAMICIWQIAPCFVKDVIVKYDDPKPPYTTVASIFKNLERKGYIKGKRIGNTYEYYPLIAQDDYATIFMNGVVQNYFENSYKDMVTFFARDQKISAKELREIIDMIENKSSK